MPRGQASFREVTSIAPHIPQLGKLPLQWQPQQRKLGAGDNQLQAPGCCTQGQPLPSGHSKGDEEPKGARSLLRLLAGGGEFIGKHLESIRPGIWSQGFAACRQLKYK